jgi:nucleoside 2-deoxyribosyltransferase
MLVFVGCNYERIPIHGFRDAFREVQASEPRIQFRFADVRISNKAIMEKVRDEILHCDAGLYDVTFRNPNVMMELGVAVGSGRPWNILYNPDADSQSWLTKGWFNKKTAELPANLRGYEYLQYTSEETLKDALTRWAEHALCQAPLSTVEHWLKATQALTALLTRKPGITIHEIATDLGAQHVSLVRLTLSELRKKGALRSEGRGPSTRYFVSTRARRDPPPRPRRGTAQTAVK